MVASADTFGPYRIEMMLGMGGMGVVHRAVDTRTGQPVALKRLRPELTRGAEARRFLREARAVRRLVHPNIVSVFEDGEHDGCFYIAMELIEGPALRFRLGAPMPVQQLSALAVGAASALAVAHELDVVHRDIKPANLLLRDELRSPGVVAVCDFGLAKLLDEAGSADPTTQEGAVLGTPAYMAPEQAAGHRLDARTDIYGLGTVLFEAAAGRRPFNGGTPLALMMQHATDPVPELSPLAPDLPEPVCRAIEACLAKSPTDRPQSTRALVEVFSPYLPPSAQVVGDDDDTVQDPDLSRMLSAHFDAVPSRPRPSSFGVLLALFVGGLLAVVGAVALRLSSEPRAVATPIRVAASVPPAEAAAPDAGVAAVRAGPEPASALAPSTIRKVASGARGPTEGSGAEQAKKRSGRRRRRPRTPPSPAPAVAAPAPVPPDPTPSAPNPEAAQAAALPDPAPPSAADLPTSARSAPSAMVTAVAPTQQADRERSGPSPSRPNYRFIKIEVLGGSSRGRIESLLRRVESDLVGCLRELGRPVDVRFDIGFMGRGRAVEVQGASGEPVTCLETQIRAIRFPRPDTGATGVRLALARQERA
ncbi:MAG: serine/threonine-protein kinase [Myxococcota bacterium]